jgi:hypothetical protein
MTSKGAEASQRFHFRGFFYSRRPHEQNWPHKANLREHNVQCESPADCTHTPIMSSATKYEEVRMVHAMSYFVNLTVKRRRDQDVGPVSWRRWCCLNDLACRET